MLVRRMPAIETLGASTVLCVDKTGTLTLNRMILNSLFSKGEYCELEKNKCLLEKFHELLEFGYLASQRDPFDPLEKEIKRNTEKFLSNTEHIHEEWKTVREYPLSKKPACTFKRMEIPRFRKIRYRYKRRTRSNF
ncbi:hypothetical protein [Methanosarcina barkeri]|uniref:hypothetical protein n=1 Tax=Methanosarcina barkeri TaxID=2208 RepID=UPI001FB238E2|nr:hypothetical protein [Methanosarcina barkeri]